MKRIFLFAATLLATTTFGQINNGRPSATLQEMPPVQAPDTALQVFYVEKDKLHELPAFFINGKFVRTPSLPASVKPQTIDKIDVVRKDTLVDNVLYRGRVYIETSQEYAPRLITLNDLKNKYTNLKGKPALFIIDGKFINADYNKYFVDENTLLTIIIDNVQNGPENNPLGLITVLSKTEENIKARNRIIIRGGNIAVLNEVN